MAQGTIQFVGLSTAVYLGAGVVWTGSGTPWNTASTSPYELANNSVTGQAWTPTSVVPDRDLIPAATGGGLRTLTRYPDIVEETIPIQIKASTPKYRLDLLQLLRQILNAASVSVPAQLVIEPNDVGSLLSPEYFEVYGGTVQEDAVSTFGSEMQQSTADTGHQMLRATITLLRSAAAAGVDTADEETLVNALTQTNTSVSGANLRTLAPTKGDLRYEGQPLNMTLLPISSATAARVHLASVLDVVRDTTGYSATAPGASFASIGIGTLDVSAFVYKYPVTPRLFVYLSSISGAACAVKVNLSVNGGGTYHTIDVSTTGLSTTATGRLLDLGDIPIPLLAGQGTTSAYVLNVDVQAAGSGSTITIGYIEVIFYHEYCVISGLGLTSSIGLAVTSYPSGLGSNVPYIPYVQPVAQQYSSTSGRGFVQVNGTLPRARATSYLWFLATTEDFWGGTMNAAHTFTLTAKHAPQWLTLRN